MKKFFFLAAVSMLVFSACKKDKVPAPPKETLFKTVSQGFQHGKTWSWYEVDAAGNPLRIAVAIDDAAMNSLDTTTPGSGGHHHQNSLSLKLPAQAVNTPFTHVLLDWNPKGHEPEFIYGKPHFDFHFYMSTEAERLAIPPYEVDSTKFKIAPAAAYLPANYVHFPAGVPQMGSHCLDVTSPELSGAPFTETFIYGAYDGKVTFYEPMITGDFVKNNPNFQRAIPQPARFQKAGWYPTKMRLAKVDGVTSIILEGFVKQPGS